MPKKIYRTWKDDLPLWLTYAGIAAAAGAVLVFIVPQVYKFLLKLDWHFFAKDRSLYLRWIFQGLIVTLRLSAISMVFALIFGTLVGIGRLSHSRLIRGICTPYVEFFRNTPLLVQLFFWYFGTSSLLDALASLVGLGGSLLPGITAFIQGQVLSLKEMFNKGQSEFISGVIGLSIYTSAFIAETVRAGIMAIPHGQTEASRATGLNSFQTLWYVILPQAFRIVIPPLLSQFLALTKNSAQAMAIGVAEVTYMARQVEANTFKGFEAFTVATGLYMVMSFIMSYLLNRYDRSISIPALTERRQRVLAERNILRGYRLGKVFAAAAAAAGIVVFIRGGAAVASGSWMTGLWLYLFGLAAVAAGMVALALPYWGLGFIKAVLAMESVGIFFALLSSLNRGLVAFEYPWRQIGVPLAQATVYALGTVLWWAYFNRRESLFCRRPDGGGER